MADERSRTVRWRNRCAGWAPLAVLLAAACSGSGESNEQREADRALALEDSLALHACRRDTLAERLGEIEGRAGGRMSVSFVDPATNERFSYAGGAPIFMSSVVKLPLAVQLLSRVDLGELRLADTVAISAEELSLGRTPLAVLHPDGFSMRVDSLLRYAISESDNTAFDALLRYSGGPAAATAELRELGIAGVRIDRDYLDYGWDLYGGRDRSDGTRPARSGVDRARQAAIAGSAAQRDSLSAAFSAQAEDRASSDALVALLARLSRGELLSDSSRALLLRFMTESQNPVTRIVAGLPAGATVAHKTGTWSDWNDVLTSVSDVGIVRLSDGRELALAIMVAEARASQETVDSAIADAARAVLSDWVRCSPPPAPPR